MSDPAGRIDGLGRSAAELVHQIDPDRTLTREQESVVSAGLSPMLVVAGAGSGKTETLSLRILYLLDNAPELFGRTICPDEILCLTFTRKAAAEIAQRSRQRIDSVYGRDPARPQVSVSTYNAYAAQLAAEHGLRVAVDPGSTVLTDAALWQLADTVVRTWTADLDTSAAVSSVVHAIPRLAAQARDHQVSPARLREWAREALAFMASLPKKQGGAPAPFTQELARTINKVRSVAALADLVEEFDNRKRVNSWLDFSDQVDIAVQLAHLPHVQQIERSRYVAVLLDEFQDTSPPQLDLFARLFGPSHSVMAVGDPNQAIYGFRGASAQALDQFVQRFGGDHVARGTLSVSWRNESSILDAANDSVAPLSVQRLGGVPLRSRSAQLGVPEPVRAAPGVVATRLLDRDDEADAVARFITDRRAELGHRPGRPVTAAVLCRKRSQQGAIVDALARAGIAYEVVGLGGLLDTPEVADVRALLEVAHDPSRGDSLMRLLAGERIALGPRDLAALYEHASHLAGPRDSREGQPSLADALADLPGMSRDATGPMALSATAYDRLANVAQVIESIRRHTYLPLSELVQFAQRAWGLDIEVAVARPDDAAHRAMDAFVDATRTFAASAQHATLGAFLAWLEAVHDEENGLDAPVREPDPQAVQVLTVHAAKGLEWDIVAVPGLSDGQFPKVGVPSASRDYYSDSGWLESIGNLPHELRLDRDALPVWAFHDAVDHKSLSATIDLFKEASGMWRLDEERRLFYVALTRARSHVLLSGSWYASGTRPVQPSPFVTELLDVGSAIQGEWVPAPDATEPPERVAATALWPREVTAAQQRRRDLAVVVRDLASTPVPWDESWPMAREVAAMLAEADGGAADSPEVALPANLSTSNLVAIARDADAFALQIRRPIPQEPTSAAYLGSTLHSWIENHYRRAVLWDDDPGEQIENLEQAKETFLASEWAPRTPLEIEVGIDVTIAGVTVRSRIDAVFGPGQGLDKVTVVDWKSGRPPGDDDERAAREVQLAMYRLAWAQHTGEDLDAIDAAFYYVSTNQTVRPQRLLTREQIEGLLRPKAR